MIDKLNYENVLHVLITALNGNTKVSERIIAHQLLSNFQAIPNSSIEHLASICYISQPTLTRFIKRLGYQNYSEFKSYVTEFQFVLDSETANDLFGKWSDDIHHTHLEALTNSLHATCEKLDINQIKIASKLIFEAQNIVIIGIDYSQVAAYDAQLRFMRYQKIFKTAVTNKEQKILVDELGENDLVIVLSVSGKTKGLRQVTNHLPSDVNCVVISSNPCPTILRHHPNRKLIQMAEEANQHRNTSQSGRINLMYIIDLLFIEYGQNYYYSK